MASNNVQDYCWPLISTSIDETIGLRTAIFVAYTLDGSTTESDPPTNPFSESPA